MHVKNWMINKSDRGKIETAEVKFLCSVVSYRILDQKHSEDIRTVLQILILWIEYKT